MHTTTSVDSAPQSKETYNDNEWPVISSTNPSPIHLVHQSQINVVKRYCKCHPMRFNPITTQTPGRSRGNAQVTTSPQSTQWTPGKPSNHTLSGTQKYRYFSFLTTTKIPAQRPPKGRWLSILPKKMASFWCSIMMDIMRSIWFVFNERMGSLSPKQRGNQIEP